MDHQEQNNIKADIFRAYDIRGIYPSDFNESTAYFIGVALGNRIQGQKKAVVAMDGRLSGPNIKSSLINGLQAILNNQNDKNGILLLFKHSLHLELDSRILAMHSEIYGIEREHNSKMFENIQRSGRLKSMKGITDRDNTLTFMRWLKKGKTVLYAPDQDYGIKKSIKVNFFGIPAATVTAPLKIIEKTGCKVFFINSYFNNGKLILDLEEINIDQSSVENFSRQLNLIIENKIRLHPHEYLWQHRRFKSTLGKKKIYQ